MNSCEVHFSAHDISATYNVPILWTTAPLLRLLRTLHGCHSTRQCVVYSQYPIAYVLRAQTL